MYRNVKAKKDNKNCRLQEYYKKAKPTLCKIIDLKICLIKYFQDAICQLDYN